MRQYPLRENAQLRASCSGMPAARSMRNLVRTRFHSFQRTCRKRRLRHLSSSLNGEGVSANAK